LATNGNPNSVAFTIAGAIVALAYCFGEISGGYLNPSVTLGAVMIGEISIIKAILYTISEMLGAFLGALLLYGLTPSRIAKSTEFEEIATGLHKETTLAQGVFIEACVTFALVFVFMMTGMNKHRPKSKNMAPFIIAAVYASGVLFAFEFTDASLNPARSFGTAIVTGYWKNHWIYWVGPNIGTLFAVMFFKIFETHWTDEEKHSVNPDYIPPESD